MLKDASGKVERAAIVNFFDSSLSHEISSGDSSLYGTSFNSSEEAATTAPMATVIAIATTETALAATAGVPLLQILWP